MTRKTASIPPRINASLRQSVTERSGREGHDLDQSKKKSGLGAGSGGVSSPSGEEKGSDTDVVANVGSSLSAGNDVSIKARESDVNIIGSHVAAGKSCEDCGDIALKGA